MSDLNNSSVKDIDDMHDKQIEKMEKEQSRDRSKPNNVNTEEWWKWENLSDKTKLKATATKV